MVELGLFIWAGVNLLLAFKVQLGAAELLVQPALILAYILIVVGVILSHIHIRGKVSREG